MQDITAYPKDLSVHIRDVFLALKNQKDTGSKSAELTIYLGEVDDGMNKNAKHSMLKFLELQRVISKLAIKSENIEVDLPEGDTEMVYGATATFVLDYKKFKKIAVTLSLEPRFTITTNVRDGIIINDEYCLLKPQDGSQPFHFWQYILKNPNKVIPTKDILMYIQQQTGINEPFSVRKTLHNYGFIRPLSKAFFPIASAKSVCFQNPVFQSDIDKLMCSEKALKKSYERLKSNQQSKTSRPKSS